MLYYDRIRLSEGIYLAKSNNSKECIIHRYRFFNQGCKFQDSICNGCHNLTMLSINITNVAKNVDYFCIIHNSKSEAI